MHHSIEIEGLSYSYPDGRTALRNITLRIAPGEKVALVGPNGAGKSTLLLHLNGILIGTGSITVSGMRVEPPNLGRIRAAVGMVFQNPDDQLFSPTVFDDVAFGPIYQGLAPEEVRARAEAALGAMGMETYSNRVSHHLSMGEKKAIAIATVLSMQPEVLVLDEPTAGLDPRSRRSLLRRLKDLDMTMLIASHDLAMVREAIPRMIIMDEGQIVADGQSTTLLADEALLNAHGLESR
jgi:cobalt/nickel transport system ATP-binding protein